MKTKKVKVIGCDIEKCGNGRCWGCKRKVCYECDATYCKNYRTFKPCRVFDPETWEKQTYYRHMKELKTSKG
jgi:hypothetical protein